jgi:hypothetical protein
VGDSVQGPGTITQERALWVESTCAVVEPSRQEGRNLMDWEVELDWVRPWKTVKAWHLVWPRQADLGPGEAWLQCVGGKGVGRAKDSDERCRNKAQ